MINGSMPGFNPFSSVCIRLLKIACIANETGIPPVVDAWIHWTLADGAIHSDMLQFGRFKREYQRTT